jgi:tetratricopeptide (TPR) repeat protein
MPRDVKIFISGTTKHMRREREALARALRSLHLDTARIDDRYSDERAPREENLALIYECDICIGLHDRSQDEQTDPAAGVTLAELEFDEARRLEKPQLIFVKQLDTAERRDPSQSSFLDEVMSAGGKQIRVYEFKNPAELEDQVAEALMAFIPERFGLRVTRPVFQAPRRLETFVGRAREIEQLTDALAHGRTVLIHGLGDVGGMGKTELAVYAAHHLRDQFPNGVLWANVETVRPGDLLLTWARAFGGFESLGRGDLRFEYRALSDADRRITEIAIRIDEARRVLQGKRVLVILDGIVDERDNAKIAPLLQALADCPVILTSRTRRLWSMQATTLIELGRMNEDEAWDLFARIAGENRLEDQRGRVAEIGQVVDFVPLALDLAATHFREHQPMSLQTLLDSLQTERGALELAAWGYRDMRGLQSALNVSYSTLSEDDKHFFAALGAFAGEDFDANAAGAVAEVSPFVAARTLEELSALALVQHRHRWGRFDLHPVLRDYARDKLEDHRVDERMAKYYCELAKDNGRKLISPDSHAAHAALTAELSNIFAGHAYARKRNDRIGWELCRDLIHGAMTYYFNLHAMWSDWIVWCQDGLEACVKLEDEASALAIATSLGMVCQRKGDWDQAIEFYRNALVEMGKLDNPRGIATIYMNLGVVQLQKEQWKDALVSLTKSLQLREQLGDKHGMAQTRANLGMLYARHGEKTKARAYWTQALELFDSTGARNEADIVRKWLRGLSRGGRE